MDEPRQLTRILPCGATGDWDNTGYRCRDCMSIYGCLGCPCTKAHEPQARADSIAATDAPAAPQGQD